MDLGNGEKGERALRDGSDKIKLSWQLKALLAGRIPLPTSRPKRSAKEVQATDSGETNSTSEEDDRSIKTCDSPHGEDLKGNFVARHITGASKPKY